MKRFYRRMHQIPYRCACILAARATMFELRERLALICCGDMFSSFSSFGGDGSLQPSLLLVNTALDLSFSRIPIVWSLSINNWITSSNDYQLQMGNANQQSKSMRYIWQNIRIRRLCIISSSQRLPCGKSARSLCDGRGAGLGVADPLPMVRCKCRLSKGSDNSH